MAQAAVTEKYRQYEELAAAMAAGSIPTRGDDAKPMRRSRRLNMSLATTYLGLTLKNPLVASASPLTGKLDNLRRLEDAGAGADRAAVVVPGADRGRGRGAGVPRRCLSRTVRPKRRPISRRRSAGPYGVGPDRYLDLVRRAKGGGRHPRHRQPERIVARRLDRTRAADRAGRRLGARAEHVSRSDRPAGIRPRRRGALYRDRPRPSAKSVDAAGRGQADPISQFDRPLRHDAGRAGRGRARAVQPPAGARYRSRRACG